MSHLYADCFSIADEEIVRQHLVAGSTIAYCQELAVLCSVDGGEIQGFFNIVHSNLKTLFKASLKAQVPVHETSQLGGGSSGPARMFRGPFCQVEHLPI